jgi:hypothetical protein
MGVEHGGSSQEGAPGHRRKVDHVDGVPVRDTSAPEPGTTHSGEEARAVSAAVPVEVFDRIEELQRQLAEAQAKIKRRQATDRAASKRWRDKDPERARALTNARVRAYRARKRQTGS